MLLLKVIWRLQQGWISAEVNPSLLPRVYFRLALRDHNDGMPKEIAIVFVESSSFKGV